MMIDQKTKVGISTENDPWLKSIRNGSSIEVPQQVVAQTEHMFYNIKYYSLAFDDFEMTMAK